MAEQRRSYGAGSLHVRADRNGVETWYGRWKAGDRYVNRQLGRRRVAGTREGLTRPMAEDALRRLMAEVNATAALAARLALADVAARYLTHLEALGRKRTTIAGVESALRVWIVPQLGDKTLDAVRPEDVEDLMRTMRAGGVGGKSIRNYIGTLSAVYKFAMHPRRRWATVNPVAAVDLPPIEALGETIRFLTVLEVETLASAAVDGEHQALDRTLYLCAAMTGLRQGELIALCWSDIDWQAQRVRVRRNHVLGEFDTPKSRRSTRSVPLSGRVAVELDGWQQSTAWGADGDLVFAEPLTGGVLRRGALMRRYHRALTAAMLDEDHRFHDLRHTFGTAMAAAGVPMRTLQEWMGHRDLATTQRYADYAPNAHEVAMVDRAFADTSAAQPTLQESPGGA
jgi:integrase